MALAEFESATNMKATTTMTPEMLLKQQEEQSSTLIQMELQRIEKMKKRQQKELESMIQVRDLPGSDPCVTTIVTVPPPVGASHSMR